MSTTTAAVPIATPDTREATLAILFALSLSHLLNDAIQALIPAVYPLLKDNYGLNFTQIGLITLAFQMTGSIFQPLVGFYTDKHPRPYSLVFGMGLTLAGLVLLAFATVYPVILAAACMVGLGSAIFHPDSSRIARAASGGRLGFAQSLFQVGGNAGTAIGPLLAASIIVPNGQRSILVFTALAFVGMMVLFRAGRWYAAHLVKRASHANAQAKTTPYSRRTIVLALTVLLLLMFSKFFYLAGMSSYYTFFLIEKFGVSIQASQVYLFLFLFGGACGTLIGGHIGDKIGRKAVIWVSILGMAPFSLILPHANLPWTIVLAAITGFIMSSAFPAILVFATELLPAKPGLIAGLFFGLAFGLGGSGSALLGKLADATSIPFVMLVCSFLPLIGILTALLPDLRRQS